MTRRPTILVEGANGYIGLAVCRAFIRAGWKVFGLVRSQQASSLLATNEVLPVISALPDLAFLDQLYKQTPIIDVVAICSAPSDYAAYFTPTLSMIQDVARTSTKNGVKPLVLWTSGSKDYGYTLDDGDENLQPHTENSPITPQFFVAPRTTHSLKILEHPDLFDAAVLRPTNVMGYSSSIMGMIFDFAAEEAAKGSETLKLNVSPRTIMHMLHVDDCAEAYVALAQHPHRSAVAGQCFNISAEKYDTAQSVLQALADEYGIKGGAEFGDYDKSGPIFTSVLAALFGNSQWCSSARIRALTGWTDKRMSITENMHLYRRAYESAAEGGDEDVMRNKTRKIRMDELAAGTRKELS